MKKSFELWIESLFLFIVVPFLYLFDVINIHLFLVLWGAAISVMTFLSFRKKLKWKNIWNVEGLKRDSNFLVWRMFFVLAFLSLVSLIFDRENLFALPRERTLLWVLIMIFYPLFSALPQEIVYRTFFFERYSKLFNLWTFLLIYNAFLFGLGHVMFSNYIAVVLSFFGSLLFAYTYHRTNSLLAVWLEHSFYGCLLFTLGIGRYFVFGFN